MDHDTFRQQLSYFTIKHLNEEACRFSGFDYEEIIGKNSDEEPGSYL